MRVVVIVLADAEDVAARARYGRSQLDVGERERFGDRWQVVADQARDTVLREPRRGVVVALDGSVVVVDTADVQGSTLVKCG